MYYRGQFKTIKTEEVIQLANVGEFTRAYLDECSEGMRIQVMREDGELLNNEFVSDLRHIHNRACILERWLIDRNRNDDGGIYAITILSEIWARDLIRNCVTRRGESNYWVRFAPSQLDASDGGNRSMGRGMDILLVKPTLKAIVGVGGVDVTIASERQHRDTKKPGLSSLILAPVVVLYMGDLVCRIDDHRCLGARQYLEQVIKPAIKSGVYNPYIHISPEGKKFINNQVKTQIGSQMQRSRDMFIRLARRRTVYTSVMTEKLDALTRVFGD